MLIFFKFQSYDFQTNLKFPWEISYQLHSIDNSNIIATPIKTKTGCDKEKNPDMGIM
jgi:hypothetical protein